VNGRAAGVTCAALGIALTVAQVVEPGFALYHGWQYALALGLVLAGALSYGLAGARGRDGAVGRRLATAMAGAAVVTLAGLAAGLLGPDTAEIIGTPGTVVPIPALGAAAFFAPADAAAIAAGRGDVVLRRRGAAAIAVGPGGRRILGESVLSLVPRVAAYVDAFDAGGAHLTVTQPTSTSFLSPVLLFRTTQRIGPVEAPFDTFATPARGLTVRALYFTPADLTSFGHAGLQTASPALVLSAGDERGREAGIAMAPSGRPVELAGIRVRATLGTYPALEVAAAPPLWALIGGIVVFVGALVWAGLGARGGVPATVAAQSRTPIAPEATTGVPSVPTT
jgi:hypothetical protein